MDLDRELDDLFAGPLESFTSARNDLARRLTDAGRRDEARTVKALRKPTVSAWHVNRLARSHPAEIKELVELGRSLQGEPTAEDVRRATARRRRLVAELTRAVEGEARRDDRTLAATTIARVSQTLYAAGAGAGADEVLHGRLTRDLDVSELDQMFSLGEAPTVDADEEESERARAARERVEELERLAQEAEAEADEATAEAERAARAASSAAARAEVARRSATKARERVDRARSAL